MEFWLNRRPRTLSKPLIEKAIQSALNLLGIAAISCWELAKLVRYFLSGR